MHSKILKIFSLTFSILLTTGYSAEFVKIVADMSDATPLNLEGDATIAAEGPHGEKVLKADGQFSGRIDLNALGIDPKQYDLAKVEIKFPRGANFNFSIENYPEAGDMGRWYSLDGSRGANDWRTIWVDLHLMEELRKSGAYKGMTSSDRSLKGLTFGGHIHDFRRSFQEPETPMWIRNFRFVKKVVDLDWDQIDFKYSWNKGEDLVYTYPLKVKNCSDKPITAKVSLLPFSDVKNAKSEVSPASVPLNPGETKIVAAKVWLPADAAAKEAWLYCENFEARASAEGIEDSEVTILRGSDPIHLSVTIPIPEEKLKFPLFHHWKTIPDYAFNGYDEAAMRECIAKFDPANLKTLVKEGDRQYGSRKEFGVQTADSMSALQAMAFLYDYKGEKNHLGKFKEAFKNYAEIYSKYYAEDKQNTYRVDSDGILAFNTLRFGFIFGGTTRPPYFMGFKRNQEGTLGKNQGHLQAFDTIAADLTEEERQYIIKNLFVPAMLQSRNHYTGLGNQQLTYNVVTFYGALVSRNWPAAGFAYSSEHGLLNHIKWAFDDDGLCLEGEYQAYTITPMLQMTELMHALGVDLYDQRVYEIVHSTGAKAIGFPFSYSIVKFLDEQRFASKPFVKELMAKQKETDGFQLVASTLLKWKDLEVGMNWGTFMFRGSRDRCALRIHTLSEKEKKKAAELQGESGGQETNAEDKKPAEKSGGKGKGKGKGGEPASTALNCGGGSYNHSSFGQSVIIINDEIQHSVPGKVTGYDIVGPIQYVQAESKEHYPGTLINRTFALLEKHVLTLDRVVGDKPQTIDWYLKNACQKISVPSEAKTGSWVTKPRDTLHGLVFGGEVTEYQYSKTDGTWNSLNGGITMLGEKNSEIMLITNQSAKGKEKTKKEDPAHDMVVRRKDAKATDFITFFSHDTKTLERVPVQKTSGGEANAIGVKITLKDGKSFQALANYEPEGTEVVLGSIKTKDRFATDFTPTP